jgi:hypothetical protein
MALELGEVVVCIIRPIFEPLNIFEDIFVSEEGIPLVLEGADDSEVEVRVLSEVR